MSQQLINLSPDLVLLREDGYEVSIEHGHLLLRNIPYVNANQKICRGMLVSTLSVSGNKTNPPNTGSEHVMMFSGEYPCNHEGKPLEKIRLNSSRQIISGDLIVNHSFSSKPKLGYADYYEKMTTYAALLCSPAVAIDPLVTPRTGRIIDAPNDSPFVYFDNASGRAGITSMTQKLKRRSIAIIGLGGTGSYVLDLVSKTPVEQIHIYDADSFEQHNAFRTPGAVSLEQLKKRMPKVDYFAEIYSNIHKGIVPHTGLITSENTEILYDHEMVFLCIDKSEAKIPIIAALEDYDIPFIDVGMGLEIVDDSLIGTIRTTTSTPRLREHVHSRDRIPLKSADADNVYTKNIQIAELNALNACLAVIRWKKLWGFYKDTGGEHFSLFTLDGNHLLNQDVA